jgi:hypothetical protein
LLNNNSNTNNCKIIINGTNILVGKPKEKRATGKIEAIGTGGGLL